MATLVDADGQPLYRFGTRVAVGDVDGDGTQEVIVGAGPGIVSEIKVYDGSGPVLLRQFLPYHTNHTGGLFLAAGMASLLTTYNAAVAAADAAFDAALLAADVAYDGAIERADQAYQQAVETATDVFDGAVTVLQTAFEQAVTSANTVYDDAMQDAATAHSNAVQTAEDAYTTTTQTAQDEFAAYVQGMPKIFETAVLTAAGGYVSGVLSAEYSGGQSVQAAQNGRINAILNILESLSTNLTSQAGKTGESGTQALLEMDTLAAAAYQEYTEAANQAYQDASSDGEVSDEELQAAQRALALAYYETVGSAGLEKVEELGRENLELVRTLADACLDAIRNAATADESLSIAQAGADKANTIARDVGQANYLQGIKDLIAQFVIEAREKGAALEKTLNQAANDRDRAIASANVTRANAEAAAGKVVVDAVTAAEKAYVVGYAAAWDVQTQALADAAETRDEAYEQAARDWMTAALTADAAWTQAANAAAGAYRAGANSVYTSAVTSADIALAVYNQAVDSAWAAALIAANPGDPNAQIVADAWVAYDAAVIAAWTGANTAAASAATGYLDAESSASAAHASGVGQAVADQANAELQAASDALADVTAAQRAFDDSYRPAAVERATSLAQADTERAQEEAFLDQTQTNTLATVYQTAVNAQANVDQTYIQETVDALTEFLEGAETAAAGLIGNLMTQSAALSQAAAEENYTIATEEAAARKETLIAVAEMLKTRLLANAERSVALNTTRLQEDLAAVRRTINGEANGIPVEIVQDTPYIVRVSLYFYVYGGVELAATGGVPTLWESTKTSNQSNAAYGTPGSAPDAATVLQAVFGLPMNQNIQITDNFGGYVGMYNPGTGLVHRNVQRGEGRYNRPKSFDEVMELIRTMPFAWNSHEWDIRFGGSPPDDNPEDQPVYVDIITAIVGVERLAQPGRHRFDPGHYGATGD